jgi:hypothetical protein
LLTRTAEGRRLTEPTFIYVFYEKCASIFGDIANLFYSSIESSVGTGGAQQLAAGLGLEVEQ